MEAEIGMADTDREKVLKNKALWQIGLDYF